MPTEPKKTIEQVVAEVGRYPIEAYQFVREGLAFTVERTHGKETAMERRIHKLMHEHDIDLAKLDELYGASQLPEAVMRYIKKVGGVQALNRHVSGQDLCRGLCDYALKRWGMMTSTVLRGWKITETEDFGRIVFALVDNGFMQKEPTDTLEDFRDVYDFRKAFDEGYRIGPDDDPPA
jgi:uncharacterized repeat protein (TIGR04138 family)